MSRRLVNDLIWQCQGRPRIAILMSGQGSNAEVILRHRSRYPNLQFVTICTDKADSRAAILCQQYDLAYACFPGVVKTPAQRADYFRQMADYLAELEINIVLYAGFMKVSTPAFVTQFPGINIHPADLTITDTLGKPKYIGMKAVEAALQCGETSIVSTAHVVDSEVDCGIPLMLSPPLSVVGKKIVDVQWVHTELKTQCEHLLYPALLERLSQGALDINQLPYRLEK